VVDAKFCNFQLLDAEGEPLLTAGAYRCYWLFRGGLECLEA